MSENSEKPTRSFEETLGRLEVVVRQLEEGQLPLEQALARYEEGVKCLSECYSALKAAERKIELMTGIDANGSPITEPFDDAEESLSEKRDGRSRKRTRGNGTQTGDRSDLPPARGIDTPKGLF